MGDVLEHFDATQGPGTLGGCGERRALVAALLARRCRSRPDNNSLGTLEQLKEEAQLGAQIAGRGADGGITVPLVGEPAKLTE